MPSSERAFSSAKAENLRDGPRGACGLDLCLKISRETQSNSKIIVNPWKPYAWARGVSMVNRASGEMRKTMRA